MTIKVLAFGIARDILGGASTVVEIQGQGTVGDLRATLLEQYPDFAKLTSLAVAVNTEYAEAERVIRPGDEVVLIPPVAGG